MKLALWRGVTKMAIWYDLFPEGGDEWIYRVQFSGKSLFWPYLNQAPIQRWNPEILMKGQKIHISHEDKVYKPVEVDRLEGTEPRYGFSFADKTFIFSMKDDKAVITSTNQKSAKPMEWASLEDGKFILKNPMPRGSSLIAAADGELLLFTVMIHCIEPIVSEGGM